VTEAKKSLVPQSVGEVHMDAVRRLRYGPVQVTITYQTTTGTYTVERIFTYTL
jgi:hypothetical protein